MRRDSFVGALVFVTLFAIFAASPIRTIGDSQYSMLLSEHLLTRRSFALDEHFRLPLDASRYPGINGTRDPYPYQVERVRSHEYYFFPVGSSVLSMPLVAVMRAFGVSTIAADGRYDAAGEAAMQTILAALLMAALGSVFFATARLVLSRRVSVVVALVGALGTQIWSTASRALWSDTWGVFLLGVVVFVLLRHEARGRPLRPALLATLAAWMYVVRPPNAIVVVALAVYLVAVDRRALVVYLATGAGWLFALVTYSEIHFSRPLPSYYAERWLTFERFWKPLAAHLISPGRGLFVYVPVATFVLWLTLRYRRALSHRALVRLAYGVVAAHLVVISGFSMWYAGLAYGPRYLTGVVPWLFLLGVLGVRAMLERARPPRWELGVGLGLAALSVAIQSRAAWSPSVWRWNSEPPIEIYPDARVWSWRSPQLAAGLVPRAPAGVPPIYSLGSDLRFDAPESAPFLRRGFSAPESGFRWTEGHEAEIVFGVDRVDGCFALELESGAFIAPPRVRAQRVDIELDGEPIATLHLFESTARRAMLPLPKALLRPENRLTLRMPDAASPASLGTSDDRRVLALALVRMRIAVDPSCRRPP
jgi:hypothetical protein